MEKNQRKENRKSVLVLVFMITLFAILVSVNLLALTISDVRTSPSEVAPGQNARISIDIENNLNKDYFLFLEGGGFYLWAVLVLHSLKAQSL